MGFWVQWNELPAKRGLGAADSRPGVSCHVLTVPASSGFTLWIVGNQLVARLPSAAPLENDIWLWESASQPASQPAKHPVSQLSLRFQFSVFQLTLICFWPSVGLPGTRVRGERVPEGVQQFCGDNLLLNYFNSIHLQLRFLSRNLDILFSAFFGPRTRGEPESDRPRYLDGLFFHARTPRAWPPFMLFLVAGYETDKLQKFSQIFSQDDARPEAEGEASEGQRSRG